MITADFEKSARMKNNRGFECHLSSKYYFCLGNISTEIYCYDQAFDTKISNSYQTTGFWKNISYSLKRIEGYFSVLFFG